MTADNPYRLPDDVRPIAYNLTLTPDLEAFTFGGEADIDIEVAHPTSSILANAAELTFLSAEVVLSNGDALAAHVETDDASERVTFSFGRELPAGKATLRSSFTGVLNDQLRGFYRSQYQADDGSTRYLATTQFEATDARRAFPCWDEPVIKATYKVTLVIPDGLTAISNMPVESEASAGNGKKIVTFAESPKMSTYLLAFLVGDMASVEARASDGTLVRVWTTQGKQEQGRFALENSVKLLEYFNDYFGIPYPLPKMDHIAVPDFAAGAMENWGAITYRETALLFDPENSAAAARQRIMEVVAHEMAHMWFGDLVTMEWWDDLWLNESFASWMGDKAVDQIFPEWNMWTQFIFQDTSSGMSLDGLANSHSIEANVKDPAEIRELFDAISYSKGGATLRMIEEYLGEETFRAGLRLYISEHQYANAQGADLWAALDRASGKPVTSIMNSWVKQTGFPILEAETRRDNGGTQVHLAQRRFLYGNLVGEGTDDPTVWQIPVIVRGKSGSRTEHLLTERQASLSIAAGDWAKVNAGQTGFYRVNYTADDWSTLAQAVASGDLPATDRLGLENDAYALMRAGMAPATTFMEVATAYVGEEDATVWSDLSAGLRGLEMLLTDETSLAGYQTFAGSLYDKIVAHVGWDAKHGEGHLASLRRTTVLGAKGSFGDQALVGEARERFDRYRNNPSSLHPDLRSLVFNLVAQDGDQATYDRLWELEKQADLHEEKMRLLGALTRFRNQDLLRETLLRSLDPATVRIQDTVLVVVSLAVNQHGRDLAWEFIKENWGEFDRRYGKGGFAITRLVGAAGSFATDARHDEVKAFFDEHPAPSAARTIQQSLERIKLNVAWLDRNRQGIADWLRARS